MRKVLKKNRWSRIWDSMYQGWDYVIGLPE